MTLLDTPILERTPHSSQEALDALFARCEACGEEHYYHFNRPAGRRLSYTAIPSGHERHGEEPYFALEQAFRDSFAMSMLLGTGFILLGVNSQIKGWIRWPLLGLVAGLRRWWLGVWRGCWVRPES